MTPEPTSPAPRPTAAEGAGGPTRRGKPRFAPLVSWSCGLLVCALAFLLASTPARNSDLWRHLASGRLLAGGASPRGTDPFSSGAAGTAWVNHSWLTDAALYRLYELGGGRALVLGKAAAVAALAALFFAFRRRGVPAGPLSLLAAAAAVVALGPWLQLQPALLSALGVALTLYLLERPSLVAPERAGRARAQRWLLVPLFALWANLDGWFVLGPALVGLYAVGEAVQWGLGNGEWGMKDRGPLHSPFPVPQSPLGLWLLTLAGPAACLLTPYGYHTFAWPAPLGLAHAERALMGDPGGRGLVISPFGARFVASTYFTSPGAWAYYLLLAAGLVSFGLCGRALRPGRLLAWLALAALSAYQARAIPFFAAAAGPVLALNLQDWAPSRQTGGPKKEPAALLVWLSPCLLILLLVLAWPGWLQPRPWQPRGWGAEPDASLERLAERLKRWHDAGAFRPDRFALTFSPEAANYLAWLCPDEKGFLDSRWPLFGRQADDYVRMRDCLLGPDDGPGPQLGRLMGAYHLDRIILYDPDWGRTTRAYRCLLLGRPEWELLALDGAAALFGRRPAGKAPSPWKGLGPPARAAFHPGPDDRRAPRTAPPTPRPPGPLAPFYQSRVVRSPDQAEAALHLIAYDLTADRTLVGLKRRWVLALAAGLASAGAEWQPGATAGSLAVRLHLTPLLAVPSAAPPAPAGQEAEVFGAGFLALHDPAPAAELLLAVRAARRAVAADPNNGGAYLLLGEAYLRLANQPGGQRWQLALPALAGLRRVQALTALEQAAALRPDLDEAHARLVPLYGLGQMDRALDHLRARLRIAEQEAKGRGPDAARAAERRDALQKSVETVEAEVERALRIYEANAAEKEGPSKVYARADLAARRGLTRKALEMLRASHISIFGKAGAEMELELLLQAGQAYEARALLEPELEAVLGFDAYHWFQAQAAAACGDYAGADAEIDALSEKLRQVGISETTHVPVRTAVALHVADAVLARPAVGSGSAALAWAVRSQFEAIRPLLKPAGFLIQEADWLTLRGLLALETGAVEEARRHFRAAVEVWGDAARAAAGAGLDFRARPLAQQTLRLLEAKDEE
jgi:hypothetical protein